MYVSLSLSPLTFENVCLLFLLYAGHKPFEQHGHYYLDTYNPCVYILYVTQSFGCLQ
jgi:hypothetical protein